ncbi:TetR/AcrR family transcriptional regulator [Blastococcus sp. SYSU D00820]
MPRAADPAVRIALVERAAELLARRDPVTIRGLAEAAGTSTMAVYTHFGGMPGLWRAVRQEGFTRLGRRLATISPTDDAVHDLAALGAAYLAHAAGEPHLYRAMFDEAAELIDPAAAGAGLEALAGCAARAREAGRFGADADPADVATRLWAAGHGLAMLVVTGVLPAEALERHGAPLVVAVCTEAGDEPDRCRRSVTAGWRAPA